MIKEFTGKYRFLSNFYPAPLIYEGIQYPTSEHAYQAAKTLYIESRFMIAELKTPGQAKRAGRKIIIRSDWENVKLQVMEDILFCKFNQNPRLMGLLIDTGTQELQEGNYWGDRFWGVCRGSGQNHLGNLLMKVRNA